MVHKTLLGLQYTILKNCSCSYIEIKHHCKIPKSINILLFVQSLRYNILYNSLKILSKLLCKYIRIILCLRITREQLQQ